jgi:hypothetical protein
LRFLQCGQKSFYGSFVLDNNEKGVLKSKVPCNDVLAFVEVGCDVERSRGVGRGCFIL